MSELRTQITGPTIATPPKMVPRMIIRWMTSKLVALYALYQHGSAASPPITMRAMPEAGTLALGGWRHRR